ncbi:MAG: ankyrin repeat domain-containing protein [Bacteroidales bacterium]|nr:ankyrin repeat domain-containing protein [Bacteroidales bacterium]
MKKLSVLLVILICALGLSAQDKPDKGMQLIQAAENGKTALLVKLLNAGVDPNIATLDGMTPLHYAVQNGHLSTVKALILNGARINQTDDENRTPLLLAVHFNQLDIAEYLVQKKANVNIADNLGVTPLFYAAAYGDYIMTDMFLFYKGKQKVKDSDGKTPFLVAIWGGFPEVANLLKRYGANINTTDYEGNTALHLAAQNHDTICIDSLLSWGINLETANKKGFTVLDQAVEAKDSIIVKKLIRSGADVNHSISRNFTTVDLAYSEHVPKSILTMLSEAGGKQNKLPTFTIFSLGPTYVFNSYDSRLGLMADLTDRKYLLGLQAGVSQRPGRIKVLHDMNDTLAYQFRETRTNLTLGMSKRFRIARINSTEVMGIELAARLEASFSDYKASTKNGAFQLYAYPEIIWYTVDRNIRYMAGYQYIPLSWNNWGPHRFRIGVSIAFNEKF